MLFDTHAHLNDEKFDIDRDDIIAKIKKDNISFVVNPGADMKSSISSIELANKYDFIFAAVGVHPHDVKDMTNDDITKLKELATNKKVVAIGEIGLDYYYDNSKREDQRKWFIEQIKLANELKLPIIIHDRDAHEDCFNIIKEYKSNEIGCVLHSFSGSVELAKEYVKLGCMLSISGPVTFKNNKKTPKVVKEIPLKHLMIETDSPYLTPHPYRGKRNDPTYVCLIAQKIADEKEISYEEVCKTTLENAKTFFNIN
ncbi:TatD family hydrolase [Peptostreptococcaceae bacterium AGR-M142]